MGLVKLSKGDRGLAKTFFLGMGGVGKILLVCGWYWSNLLINKTFYKSVCVCGGGWSNILQE